jgi:hypothetical protein
MPGIITHNKILFETISYLKKEKHRSIYSKSIEVLFQTESFLKAGLFGAIGPNIFSYIPFIKKNYINGSEISYELHSTKTEKMLKSMLNMLLSYKDQNNEWASNQRAYLYGLISHLISDSIFHPFIYYWSGFTKEKNKKELSSSREQHILFENNMDIFFSKYYDEDIYNNKYIFNLNDMLPVIKKGWHKTLERAVKSIIMKPVKELFPEDYKKLVFLHGNNDSNLQEFLVIDVIPSFIKLAYKLKISRNPKLIKILNFIKKKNIFFSEYIINYPSPGKVNTHVLNLHKERWFHPTGATGLHYESVKDLLMLSCQKTSSLWKKIDEILNSDKKNISAIEEELKMNTITGIYGKDFNDMQIQNPVHLR